jgi:subtilase family serine protease
MGPTLGSATVFVDGSEVATISLHRASKRTRMVVWRMNWTTSGSHTVKIVVDGTAGHPLVEVDAFAVQR